MAVTPKIILQGAAARDKVMQGAKIMAEVVGTTLGPKGRNVSLASKYGGVITVHDGVTVAREIKLEDPQEDLGATLIREAASKTNDSSGDGTTTSTILAYEIAREGNTHVVAGANPMLLVKGIERAVTEAVSYLEKRSEPIKDSLERMIQVATISAADETIGQVVAEALRKVGKFGVVTVDKGSEYGFHTEFKDGMEWDQGWIHPGFVLQVLDGKPNIRLEARVENPFILITDHTITSPREIIPFLNRFVEAGHKNLLIISDGVERQAMTILGENFARGMINVLPVPAPSFGEHKRDGLEDIAILTGGTFISKELGKKLEDTTVENLGRADLVTATRESTVLIGGKGDRELIKARAKLIEGQMDDAEHEYAKEKHKERLAKLTSGVAVIKVGTASDSENREKIERVKDAIGATKAAVEDGIIEGGGVALLEASNHLVLRDHDIHSREENLGYDIIVEALKKPVKLLAQNAGINGDVIASQLSSQSPGIGYNVVTGEFVNLKAEGIVDPVQVTISALKNAASVASMILTTEATITDKPQPEEKQE